MYTHKMENKRCLKKRGNSSCWCSSGKNTYIFFVPSSFYSIPKSFDLFFSSSGKPRKSTNREEGLN